MITTECPSLCLSRLSIDDIDAYYALIDRNRRHLTQHGNYLDMQTATRETVREELERPTPNLVLGIRLDDVLIGRVDLIPKEPSTFVIGYWLGQEWLGRGYVTMACRTVIAHAHTSLDATTIYAGVTKDNDRSEAVLARLGFTLVQDMGSYNRFRLSI